MSELLNQIFELCCQSQATDIHLKPGLPPVLRIAGLPYRTELPALSSEEVYGLIREMFSPFCLERLEREFNTDGGYTYKSFRFRLNAYRDIGGYNAALRRLNNDIPEEIRATVPPVLFDLSRRKNGLILITGPTGSGKTTTLAALIQSLNETESAHILSIEDPIEYVFPHKKCMITQREIGRDALSYNAALIAALREDPDVIMIGEMRDPDSIQGAITAAETGHLVLATLHTRGAVNSVDRIIDVFPPDKQALLRVELSMVLLAVVSQQLVPALQPGRRALASEVMIATNAVKNLIRTGKTELITSFLQTSKRLGMYTMDDSLAALFGQGLISDDTRRQYSYADIAENPSKKV